MGEVKGAEAVEAVETVALALYETKRPLPMNRDLEVLFEARLHEEARHDAETALRADPLRAYIREQTERVECACPRCDGVGTMLDAACPGGDPETWPCSRCGGVGKLIVPRYQAEGGWEAFIAGLEARL